MKLDEVVRLTRGMFSGSVEVETSFDPDDPAQRYVVFRVHAGRTPGDIESVIDRELTWYRNVARIAPEVRGSMRIVVE